MKRSPPVLCLAATNSCFRFFRRYWRYLYRTLFSSQNNLAVESVKWDRGPILLIFLWCCPNWGLLLQVKLSSPSRLLIEDLTSILTGVLRLRRQFVHPYVPQTLVAPHSTLCRNIFRRNAAGHYPHYILVEILLVNMNGCCTPLLPAQSPPSRGQNLDGK